MTDLLIHSYEDEFQHYVILGHGPRRLSRTALRPRVRDYGVVLMDSEYLFNPTDDFFGVEVDRPAMNVAALYMGE